MRIHTVKEGDTIFKIARQYSTPTSAIIENNALESPDRLYPGQKLVIFTPTRTYTARGGDSLEKIALRFATSEDALIKNNPGLIHGGKINPGKTLAVKYEPPSFGNSVANGFYSAGCPDERFELFLPYLTYLTVSSHVFHGKRASKLFDYKDAVNTARWRGVLPIFRIYTELDAKELLKEKDALLTCAVNISKKDGFSGVSLAAYQALGDDVDFTAFLEEFKRELMKEGLFLHLEVDGNSDMKSFGKYSDTADVCLLNYEKLSEKEIPDFEDGEYKILKEYGSAARKDKTLLDLSEPSFINGEWKTVKEAEKIAVKTGVYPSYSDATKLHSFSFNQYSKGKRERATAIYPSPENTKAKLTLLGELGYMGVSFDIKSTPVSSLMIYHLLFHNEKFLSDSSHGKRRAPSCAM